MRAPETARAAARVARDAFGGEPRVFRYLDEAEEHEVAILVAEDRPGPGLSSFSTVSLHRHPNLMDGRDIRVEFAAVASAETVANALATAAFYVIEEGWLAAPGVVFPDLLVEPVRHVVWLPPTPWEALHAVDLGEGITAHWLLAVPISESERAFLVREGYDAFDALLADADVRYWDLGREPLV